MPTCPDTNSKFPVRTAAENGYGRSLANTCLVMESSFAATSGHAPASRHRGSSAQPTSRISLLASCYPAPAMAPLVALRTPRTASPSFASTGPEKRNAFNRELSRSFVAALDGLEASAAVRAIVLTGTGDAFCAGADMTEALAAIDNGRGGNGMAMAALRVARCTKPVIGAINGFAFGGGAVLACACDIRIASERASFRFPGAEYGLVVGATVLPRLIGPALAKELIFTARPSMPPRPRASAS